jgi:hypothetical protein
MSSYDSNHSTDDARCQNSASGSGWGFVAVIHGNRGRSPANPTDPVGCERIMT